MKKIAAEESKETPKEVRIDGLGIRGTLFEDGDFPIYLTSDGRFAFEHAGWQVRTSIKAIKQLQAKIGHTLGASLKLFLARGDTDEEIIDATGLEYRYVIDERGRKHHSSYSRWYVYDEKAHKKLIKMDADFEAVKEKHGTARDAVVEALTRVTPDNFAAVLREKSESK